MLTIRPATRGDVSTILSLVRELAAFERAPDSVVATEEDFLRHGFGDRASFRTLLVEWDGVVAGFALYCFGFSTWTGAPFLHLEDLFVQPTYRKRGLGLALMQALAMEARAAGCKRFVWNVLDWNAPAIRFYESLGATVLREWLPVRVEGTALERLATAGDDASHAMG